LLESLYMKKKAKPQTTQNQLRRVREQVVTLADEVLRTVAGGCERQKCILA